MRMSLVLFVGPFVLAGIVVLFFFGRSSTMVCERTESNRIDCQIATEILGVGLKQEKIRQLQSANVEVSKGEGSVYTGRVNVSAVDTYRVMLVGNSGNVPLTDSYYSDQTGMQTTAGLINAFIGNRSHPRFELRETSTIALLIGGVLIVAGVGVIVRCWRM